MAATIQLPAARATTTRGPGLTFRFRRPEPMSLLPCLLAAAGIAIFAWISFRLGQNSGSVACVYLVTIVLTAYYGGFWQATLISVAAVACLDYFFNEPIFSFTVNRPSDWVELGAFEFTALVISGLSDRVRLREREIAAERRDASRLYQTARRILLFESPGDVGNQVAELTRDMFELRFVVVFDAISDKTYRSGRLESTDRDARRRRNRQQQPEPGGADGSCAASGAAAGAGNVIRLTRDAYLSDSNTYESGNWYCALRLGAQPVGSLALCGAGKMTALTASALASLVAIALERARSIEHRYRADAAREAEQLRTAVLDSLAHKFKTPMTVIRTAVAGLPAAGELSALQTELVTLVDQEARKLNDLACRLLETPALESDEFEPQREPLLLSHLARSVVQELDQRTDQDRFQFSVSSTEAPVLADRELIMTAIAQLTDNALKYSTPGTPIDVTLNSAENAVVLRIRSRGLEVLPCDQQRIFDRFYRAPGAQQFATGTGLGLSIVRTIATDHDGKAWAEGEPGYGTAFILSLPALGEPAA
jgi:two-component system sensor histidine kinase KdpD